jgi:hypothetical protein
MKQSAGEPTMKLRRKNHSSAIMFRVVHAPHHPTPEWVAKYKGKFDMDE